MKTLIVASVMSICAAVSASAQTPAPNPRDVMPERPTVATHAGTVAVGIVEIETGVEVDHFDDGANGGAVPAVFKIGLGSHLQLGIQTPFVHPEQKSVAFGDLAVGIKWRIADDAPIIGDFAIYPNVKFPSGSEDTGTGTTDGGLLLISSHKFGDVSLDLNLGITRRGGDGSQVPRNATVWAFSTGGPAKGPVGWVAELYGLPGTAGPAGTSPIVAVLLGPTFQLRNWFVLDTGIIAPITGPQPRAFYVGFTYNVGSLKR